MIALVQRVTQASVCTQDPLRQRNIDLGLLVFVCAMEDDAPDDVDWMANKLAGLRIFADDDGRMNRSVLDVGGSMLVVSQFTLAGDCRKGFRPSFVRAAEPAAGQALFEAVVGSLKSTHGVPVETGVFGASMQVELVNDGPVTIWIDSSARGDR